MANERKIWLRVGTCAVIPVLGASLLQTGVSAAAISSGGSAAASAASASEGYTIYTSVQSATESTISNADADSAKPIKAGDPQEPDPAKAKVSKEQAVAKLRQLFPELSKAEVQNVELGVNNVYPPPDNQMVWTIQWHYTIGNKSYEFSSRVDAMTGDLIDTSINWANEEKDMVYYPPKVSREEALKLAKAFIAKAAPSVAVDELKENAGTYPLDRPLFGPVMYDFRFERLINGVPAPGEEIYINMDGNGKVKSFHRSPEHADYPTGSAKVTADEANKLYQDNLQLKLAYIPVQQRNKADWFLGWLPEMGSVPPIDAQTGEFLTLAGDPIKPGETVYRELSGSDRGFAPVVPKEGKQLTGDEAAAIVERAFKIPEGKKLTGKSLGSYYRPGIEAQVWSLVWADEDQPPGAFLNETFAAVDAETGQILEYRQERFPLPKKGEQGSSGTEQSTITETQAEQKAIVLVRQLYPNAAEELKLVVQDVNVPAKPAEDGYTFRFQRFYQGKEVFSDTVTLAMDRAGNVQTYYNNRTSGLAEQAPGLRVNVSREEAKARYFADTKVELQYRRFGDIPTADGNTKPVVKLVYQQVPKNGLEGLSAIDAADGQWKSMWSANVPRPRAIEPVDIQGHAAKDALNILVQYQILSPDESGRVYPDKAVTRGEWLNMMAKAVDPYMDRDYYGGDQAVAGLTKESPYFNAANVAVQMGWLNRNQQLSGLDEPMTREDLAVDLTRLLGYNKLSAYLNDDKTIQAFSDADQIKAKGAAVIVGQLGLMEAVDGAFQPGREVTRAEAAQVMMRLVNLQGKTDKPVGR